MSVKQYSMSQQGIGEFVRVNVAEELPCCPHMSSFTGCGQQDHLEQGETRATHGLALADLGAHHSIVTCMVVLVYQHHFDI